MTERHPNVLFLSVDALRADRVSALGHDRPTTPTLERLAQNGAVWERAVSNGAFTQVSFHSFMTSSRPLSHGGFDRGAHGRPRSLFGAFADAGYETISLATFAWISRYFGYGDVSRECDLFLLNALVGVNGGNVMASTLRAWHSGEVGRDETVATLRPSILKLFDDVEDFCDRRAAEEHFDRLDFAASRLMTQGYDHAKVKRVVARHRTEFLADEGGYLERHLTSVPRAHEWIARDWRLSRKPAKLVAEAAFRAGNLLVGSLDRRRALLRSHRQKRYLDGADMADRILREIETRRRPDRPFLLWTHFIDTHVPYCAGHGKRWYREMPRYLAALGHDRGLDPALALIDRPRTEEQWAAWSAFYDAAVLYVDEQIGRIVDGLERLGVRDDTLIVVCGDHGEELGEHGDISHHFRLYDHNVRVPVIFHRPGMAATRIDGLTTLMDLAPSIAAAAGVAPMPGWEGEVAASQGVAARDHVLLETFHGGSCLFDRRPLYFAVRDRRWNYLWKEYRDPTDRFSPEGPELHDLEADPREQTNLYHPDHPKVVEWNAVISARMREIPEIPPGRADQAFGPAAAESPDGSRGAARAI